MTRLMACLALGLILAGCAEGLAALDGAREVRRGETGTEIVRPRTRPASADAPRRPPAAARSAEQFDTTSAVERSEAVAAPSGPERALGTTIASLGAPTEPGFWLKTPLVRREGPGRVVYPVTGKSVQVTLLPLGGPPTAGSRLSLAALRLLGAPLTGLPEITVFAAD